MSSRTRLAARAVRVEAPVLGVISEDPRLIARLGELASTAGCSHSVAGDRQSAAQVLYGTGWSVRVIDYGASFLEPASGCRFLRAPGPDVVRQLAATACPMGGLDYRGQVVLVRGTPWAPRASEAVRLVVCPRHDVDRVAEELSLLLPRPPVVSEHAPTMLGDSLDIRRVRDQVRLVGRFPEVPVLVLGETGTGKELVARALHEQGGGAGRPFVALNCTAIPENLFEAELFGVEAGAYTGASKARAGLLEAAAGGTLFLDEVGDLPPALQVKLLRVLETSEFRRVGAVEPLPFRGRLVSATNQSVTADAPGKLRADLFFRLAGFTISLAPLRDRAEDVPRLATAFLNAFVARHRLGRRVFTDAALRRLSAYAWPGNVRELRAFVLRCAIAAHESIDVVDIERLLSVPLSSSMSPTPVPGTLTVSAPRAEPSRAEAAVGLRDLERQHILRAWTQAGHNLSAAARELRIPRTTLRAKLRRFGAL